ncbi:MAG: hypothetical protein ACP5NS_00495 [Candidatus Pacearchaeota archaeon]
MKKDGVKMANKSVKVRKTHPHIILTALAALVCIFLAFKVHWTFILPAVVLWWMNKKYINKHLM